MEKTKGKIYQKKIGNDMVEITFHSQPFTSEKDLFISAFADSNGKRQFFLSAYPKLYTETGASHYDFYYIWMDALLKNAKNHVSEAVLNNSKN